MRNRIFQRKLLTLSAILAAAIVVKPASASVEVGQAAPEISAKSWFNGPANLSLAKLRGKIVVVEFWATWCPPCRKSIPHLNELQKQWAKKGVVIIGLTDEHKAKIKQFMKSQPMNYVVGTGSNDSGQYGVRGIPHAFVVDPEGTVVWRGHPMSGLDAAIEKAYETAPPTKKKKRK